MKPQQKDRLAAGAPRFLGALPLFLLLLSFLSSLGRIWAEPYDWKSVAIRGGGFVTGIVMHPTVPGLMYCRTDIGGAYRWNPADKSWVPLLDFLGYPDDEWSLMGVESIGLDPQDPNRLYMSCGWLSRPSEIMISTNQGASFTRIKSPFLIEANSNGRGSGERMAVDPNLGSTLFYGTRRDGLWKSVDYGANWSKVESFPVSTTPNNVGLVFVEFIKSSGSKGKETPEIWVGVSQGGSNLYRSTDGGATWTAVANGVPPTYMPHRAAQDGQGAMYVTFCDGLGPGATIGGSMVRKFDLSSLDSTDVTPPKGQGGFGGVTVDKQNPKTIAVSTIDRYWPQSDIYRSADGGATWVASYDANTVDTSSAPWSRWHQSGPVIDGWADDIKIDPFDSNRVYFVSGGGVFSSSNFTDAQPNWQFCSNGIEETAFFGQQAHLCSPPSGPQLFCVLADMGGFADYDLDVSPPDKDFFNPVHISNFSIDFAEQNPRLVVRTYEENEKRGGMLSTDAGSTWTEFPTHPAPVDTKGPGTLAISADGKHLVWTIAGSAPYYSSDNGATWNPSGGNDLTPADSGEEFYIRSDRVNPNKFYLYLRPTGMVYVSTDGGATFNTQATLPGWGNGLFVTYGQEGHVWVATTSDGLWRSTDSGATFDRVSTVQSAHSLGFGKPKSIEGYPVLYLHGKIDDTWGVYCSEDQGVNWKRINDDQHQYGQIQQIVGDPKIYGRCYLAAGGRGIIYGQPANQSMDLARQSGTSTPQPTNSSPAETPSAPPAPSDADPNDPLAVPKIKPLVVRSGNDMVVSFPTEVGKTYCLEYSDSPQSNFWTAVQANVAGTGGTLQITDTHGGEQPNRVYRLLAE